MFKKIVIIGNGAAGHSALEAIIASKEPCDITVVTKEKTPVYYRPMLSEYISLETLPQRFFIKPIEWYRENNVTTLTNSAVDAIDPQEKTVVLDSGTRLPYDKLIVTTGSYNFVPPLPGYTLRGVGSLRTLEDAEHIKAATDGTQDVVVIGGGLLGLELGWQLKNLGHSVDVVEMMDRLLPRQLDEESSAFFQKAVEKTGMNLHTGVQTTAIEGEFSAKGVALSSGTTLPADLVYFSVGVRADTKLLGEAGAEVSRGVIVDDYMRTSLPDVYAAGDCAEHHGINYAIWPEASAQGKVAGLSAIGKSVAYDPITPFHLYHGMNLRLFSIGDVGNDPSKTYDVHKSVTSDTLEKFFFIDNRLVGGILIGDISKSGYLKKALATETTREAFNAAILEGKR